MFKTLIINMLIFSFATPQAFGSVCSEALSEMEQLRRDAARKLIEQEVKNPDIKDRSLKAKEIRSDFAKSLAILSEEEISKAYEEEVKILQAEASQLEKCGLQGCAVAQYKELYLKLKRVSDTLWSSWRAEARAKKMLQDPEYLRSQVDGVLYTLVHGVVVNNYNRPTNFNDRNIIPQQIEKTLSYEEKDKGSFLQKIGSMYWSTIKVAVQRKNIRTRPEVKRDLVRGLSIAMLNQVAAEFITSIGSWSQIAHNFMNDSWVYANTIAMMNIQAEVGGESTEFIDRPFVNFEDGIKAIPYFIHGKNGFSTDFKEKFKKLFSIAWIELPVVLLFRLPTEAALHGLTVAHTGQVMASTLITLTAIYAYLAPKWAVVDKPLLLNAFPNYLNGTRENFEEKLFKAVRDQNETSLTSLSEFQRETGGDYSAYKAYFSEPAHPKYNASVAQAYRHFKSVTYKEMLAREANGLWDAMVIFFIVHGANAAYASVF